MKEMLCRHDRGRGASECVNAVPIVVHHSKKVMRNLKSVTALGDGKRALVRIRQISYTARNYVYMIDYLDY